MKVSELNKMIRRTVHKEVRRMIKNEVRGIVKEQVQLMLEGWSMASRGAQPLSEQLLSVASTAGDIDDELPPEIRALLNNTKPSLPTIETMDDDNIGSRSNANVRNHKTDNKIAKEGLSILKNSDIGDIGTNEKAARAVQNMLSLDFKNSPFIKEQMQKERGVNA